MMAPRLRNKRKVPTASQLETHLENIYLRPRGIGSYMGADKLYHAVRRANKYKISMGQIKNFLQKHLGYVQNRAIKPVKKRNKVLVSGIDDQFDADLVVFADKKHWLKANNNYRYILVVIDIFSRFMWAKPLRDKGAESVIKAFREIFEKSRRIPRRLRTDRGTEFMARTVRDFIENDNKITHMATYNKTKANYAERAIKTLKSRMLRYMTEKNTHKWIDVLQDFVNSYNDTWHGGIREIPKNVNKKNEKKLWWQMYWPDEEFDPKKAKKIKKGIKFAYEVNDKVRLSMSKTAFRREYDQRWSGEVFLIKRRLIRDGIPVYEVMDWHNDPKPGTFYQNELQRVIIPADMLFPIEEILERQKDSDGTVWVKVHYQYWPKKFDEWIPEEDIVNI